jgi:hypothetical protein
MIATKLLIDFPQEAVFGRIDGRQRQNVSPKSKA